jgi:hypothetical protein
VSISAPRYAAGPVALQGRPYRVMVIFLRELRERAGAGTWFVLALIYLAVCLQIVFSVGFLNFGNGLASFYGPFNSPAWPFLVLIVTTAVGSGSLADDLGSRAITLYLSRPIHLTDYLGAKAAAVGFYVALATIGPGVIGVVIVLLLGSVSATLALSAIAAFVAVGLVTTVFFTGLALALSALTSRALYAGVSIFGATLAAELAAAAVAGTTGNDAVTYIAPFADIHAAASAAFQTGATQTIDPVGSALLLLGGGLLLGLVAWLRLTRVEVVGE